MIRTLAVCLVLASAAVLPSCIGIGGTMNSQTPTQGREFMDLKEALDKGAINQAEYDQKKAQLMASHK